MKKKLISIIIVLILIMSSAAYGDVSFPEPSSEFFVNDFADVLDDDVEQNIKNINLNYSNTKEKPQIVVATVQNMQGLDENSYAVKLFEKWKIGNVDYDNGILVLLAMDERKIKIEVGYGLEGAVTDSEAGSILDASTSYLSNGQYSEGMENIFFLLAQKVNEEYGYDEDVIFSGIDVNAQNSGGSGTIKVDFVKIVVVIIVLIFLNGFGGGGRRRRNGMLFIPPIFPRGGGFGGGGFGGGFGGGGGSSGGGGGSRGF